MLMDFLFAKKVDIDGVNNEKARRPMFGFKDTMVLSLKIGGKVEERCDTFLGVTKDALAIAHTK